MFIKKPARLQIAAVATAYVSSKITEAQTVEHVET